MRFLILSVGKPRSAAPGSLFEDYCRRIRQLGATCEDRWVREVSAGGRYTEEHAMEREARALLEALPGKGCAIALDRSGEAPDSETLARRIRTWATPSATFLIGGPLGLHRSVLDRSDAVWSLSPLTFPHEIARMLVAEQLYRSLTLIRGVPYHK